MARQSEVGSSGGLKSEQLIGALERAAAGNSADLYRQLEMLSGLPGPRMNTILAAGFALDCARLGAKVDRLIWDMASLPANEARGASGKEFLSVCGVLGIGARAASSKDLQVKALSMLEDRADDLRFHVRDAVPLALASMGAKMPDLPGRVMPWMDRYFHAAAVILALAEPVWLETFGKNDYEAPFELLEAAYQLAHNAPRAAQRYPGHKALVDALAKVPTDFAKRFGLPMLDKLLAWAEKSRPELRDAILANLTDTGLKKPYGDEIEKIKAAVIVSKGPPRDPSRIVQGMRGRGKKRR